MWRQPWTTNGPPRNLISRRAYGGINIFLLSSQGFVSPFWITERSLHDCEGKVKDGETPTEVVLWQWRLVQHTDDARGRPSDSPRWVPFFWSHFLFNSDQCDGIETPKINRSPFKHIKKCRAIVELIPMQPRIEHGVPKAYYQPTFDHVNMPNPELFASAEEYYCTLFHELVHSSGHPSRLNRHKPFGEAFRNNGHAYSKEELVAVFGAAFLCARARISSSTIANSGAYIQGWLERLGDDKSFLFYAAIQAQRAVDFILAIHPRLRTLQQSPRTRRFSRPPRLYRFHQYAAGLVRNPSSSTESTSGSIQIRSSFLRTKQGKVSQIKLPYPAEARDAVEAPGLYGTELVMFF